ncbi:MAG: cell division protein FtsQ/DivIB [Rhodothermales bacterium]
MATKKKTTKQTSGAAGRVLLVGMLLVVLGALGWLGWRWRAELPLKTIEVAGARQANVDSLVALARIPPDAPLFSIDPVLVADRVRRHPWVASAAAKRRLAGVLTITIEEREPVVLVLDGKGQPSHYLDAGGYGLPLETPSDDGFSVSARDVPLLRGVGAAYHPVQPVENPSVQALLEALASTDPEAIILISELEITPEGEVEGWLTPLQAGRPSISVQFGYAGFDEKLQRLRAFWRQAVQTRPDRTFEKIDLRFDGQVVTVESPSEETSGEPT